MRVYEIKYKFGVVCVSFCFFMIVLILRGKNTKWRRLYVWREYDVSNAISQTIDNLKNSLLSMLKRNWETVPASRMIIV